MKRSRSRDNRLSDVQGFVWEVLAKEAPGVHLDFGTHDGKMLSALAEGAVIKRGVGVDVNAEAIGAAADTPKNVELYTVQKNVQLPFADDSFDSVSAVGVLEHVAQQEALLKQLYRVLKPERPLLIIVPGKHVFSFLDMGNFKFVFPRLHKWFYCFKHSKQKYSERYVECKNGLFGDIEVEKMWHQHFSHKELAALLAKCGFKVIEQDGVGFFRRPLIMIQYFLPGFFKRFFEKLIVLDAHAFHVSEICILAKK